ncbi:hypothetical protein CULT_1210002 [[Clostridium] ultunense Esp]|uniref:hypothetical protein n=1 Tax=Thermicanus aegyptius TaxID=94009 RepID=UPI0002B70D95|nr:hypothetical protein [Thermicanus aegyptius]CCQ93111.1 hypothetical protein CULT_1210002 [[Clostridium] ultunense Esp]
MHELFSNPVAVDGKGILKGRPKIYVADAAIRNAVLMLEDVITDPDQHIAAFYYTTNAQVGL